MNMQANAEGDFRQRVFDRYLAVLGQTEWAPRAQLLRYQRGMLERIVRHAHECVKFYRDRLAGLFTPSGEIDFARWSDLPIVSRQDVELHAQGMRTPQLPDIYGPVHEHHTSGSTGTPLTIASNMLVRIAGNAAFTRLARWWGADTQRPLARIRIAYGDDAAPYPEGHDWKGWSYTSPQTAAHDLDLLTPVEQQIEWLLRKKAPYLATSSSNAMALAYAMTPEQVRAIGTEIVFAIAETVLPRARELVAERLGARMAAVYSCEEIGFIATQCPVEPHYHVVAENAFVEILRDDGLPAAPGETGQAVVTGLHNYAMPFIRYAIGDVATAGAEACACGRSLPVIAQVEGRTRYAFLFKDGTRVWPRVWTLRDLGEFVPNRECQLVQIDRETIEVRYVPDGTGREPDLAGLGDYLRRKLHPSVVANAVAMDAIPRGRGGKLDPFVSMLPD
jgi:phenylacetate-coenzyme A ligase PaaK-like adenylate-forming protein